MVKLISYIIFLILIQTQNTLYIRKETNNININRISVTNYLNAPYLYGGNDLNGIDCSGLICYIYKEKFNTKIPRTSYLISKYGIISDNKIYDILVFKNHVALLLSNNKFIHATSKGVIIDSIGNNNWNYY
jgi:cell wall-associated NlpC family hydrolase